MAHISLEALSTRLVEAGREVAVGMRYTHYKHPEQEYIVRNLVIIEATEEVGVVYEAQYGPTPHISFMRPLADFCATIDVDGSPMRRFSKVAGGGEVA